MNKGLDHWADILIVIVYFIAVIAVGLWSLRTPNRGNVKSYFLAGRSMPWIAVGASLYSSNIGSEHYVGLAGAGASSGIALVLFEWFVIFLILGTGWLFLPVYVSAGVYTLPEYIHKRHGGSKLRIYLSVLSLVLYIITKLAVSIFSGTLFIQMALGWNMYLSIAVLLFIAAIYTILGGLRAVMYTDTFQTAVMTVGSLVVVGIGFYEVGGMSGLKTKYKVAIPSIRNTNTTCGFPREDAFSLFQDPGDGEYPWPGLIIQSSLGCLWYWCCDQVMVQRSLGAKNLSHAKGGALVAGFLKLLPLYLIVMPGMISRVLYPDQVACVDPDECKRICDNPVGCSNIAYPLLVLRLLPVALRGLLVAVMISAIMSSLTSIFNSSSTVFTMDIWRRLRPKATQRELLITGRLVVVAMCVLSILWIPLVKTSQSGRLFQYMTAVEGYVGSPLGITFLLSMFWKKTTENVHEFMTLSWERWRRRNMADDIIDFPVKIRQIRQGAFWGLLLTHVCGVIRLILELVYPSPSCGEPETRPAVLYNMNYLYFSPILMLICAIATVIISLITETRPERELVGVTWWTRYRSVDSQSLAAKEYTLEQRGLHGNNGSETQNESTDSVNATADVTDCRNDSTREIHAVAEGTSQDGDSTDVSNCVEANGKKDQTLPDDGEIKQTDTESKPKPQTRWTNTIANIICGFTDTNSAESPEIGIQQRRVFLTQKPLAMKFLNVAAVILICLIFFLTGFYR